MANSKKKKRNQRQRQHHRRQQPSRPTSHAWVERISGIEEIALFDKAVAFHTADQLTDEYVGETFDDFVTMVEKGEIPVGGWQFYELLIPVFDDSGVHRHEASFSPVKNAAMGPGDPTRDLRGFIAGDKTCGLAFVAEFPDTPNREFSLVMRDGRILGRLHNPDDPGVGFPTLGTGRLHRRMLRALGIKVKEPSKDKGPREELAMLAAHMAFAAGHLQVNPSDDEDGAFAKQFTVVQDEVASESADPKATRAAYDERTRESVKEHEQGKVEGCLLCKGDTVWSLVRTGDMAPPWR
jgi:hypothetical protein